MLESKFDWRGISFEWTRDLVDEFNRTRKNVCICGDATQTDFTNIIRLSGLGPRIDYLQLDIDPPNNTLKALKNIDFSRFEFAVITYEHDFYAGGKAERIESRRILESRGYTRAVSDAMYDKISFEDWRIKRELMPNENWKYFAGENISMNLKSMTAEKQAVMASMLRKMSF